MSALASESDASRPSILGGVRDDILAGMTTALIGLPQCLAYALLAGLPPAYGLVAAAVPAAVGALLSQRAQVVTGPTNTTGLLVFAALTPYLADNGLVRPEALTIVASLTLLSGIVRLLLSAAGGAELLRFIPESVLLGFTAGAGVLIGAMQLDEALGLSPLSGSGLLAEVSGLANASLSAISPLACIVCLSTAASIFFGRRYWPHFPFALLSVLLGTGLAYSLGASSATGLPLVGERAVAAQGWPEFAFPSLEPSIYAELFLPVCAIVLIGTLELTVTAQAEGGTVNMKREISAQGIANGVGAFVGAFPSSASLTRSALLRFSGARTRLAPLITAVVMVPFLLFGGKLIGWVPQASLAGVLLVIAYRMVNVKKLIRMWRSSPVTRVLLVTTGLATLVLSLPMAIVLGVGLGLVVHLARTSTPRTTWLQLESGVLQELSRPSTEVVVVEVSGDLHYAAVPAFVREIDNHLPEEARVLIVDLSHAHELRFAALLALEEMASRLSQQSRQLKLAGVREEFAELLQRSNSTLPVTYANPIPGRSLEHCWRQTIGDSVDESPGTSLH